ncbi:MAG: DNA polymerase IV [Chloroflexi bacterium]|nr:DNA polymerase IV [Chloroflexota bacterium]
MDRRILHIDLDAFYCAVEEKRDPTLKGKPFAVGGRPDQRGVVASCSYPARKYGVRSAMPMAQAVKIYPDLLIVRGHYRDYSQASRQVMDYLKEITEQVEQISIDEAFLDITKLSPSSEEVAHRMQNYIHSEFSLPCSIGIASNKLVAKIATDYGKVSSGDSDSPPNAIQIVPSGKEEEFLNPLPVNALWGVGPKTAAKLIEMNINTIGDLSQIPENEMIKHFGKWGYALSQRSRGIDDRLISLQHKAKSISQETTFAQDVSVEGTLLETIERLSNHVSQRLIKKHLQATTIKIKLRWSDFTTITRQSTLNQPTNKNQTINKAAVDLFQKAWKKGEAVRLIGVGVSGLAPEQLNLWDHQTKIAESETEKRLSTAINDLREKFGDNVLQWGDDLDDKK